MTPLTSSNLRSTETPLLVTRGSADTPATSSSDAANDPLPAAGNNLASVLAAKKAVKEPDGDSIKLARRQLTFNMMVAERSEDERELQILRTLMMQQLKDDDEITKSWIRLA